MEIFPDFEEFKSLSKKVNVIPFHTWFLADFETPVTSFLKIAKGSYNFLLESAEQEEKTGRYSFIGSYPEIIIKGKENRVEITDYTKGIIEKFEEKNSLKIIDDFLKKYSTVKIKPLPSFTGGFVGFVSYDYVRNIEKIPQICKDDLSIPDFIFFFPKKLIIFDHFKRKIFLITNVFVEKNKTLKQIYDEGKENLLKFTGEFFKSFKVIERKVEEKNDDFKSNFKKEEFLKNVEKVKKYIFEGDIIQAVISQRWEREIDTEVFKIYRALRSLNPSPYMFYLELGDLKLIGSSPEILVKLENGIANVRPIAGTRPRGKDEKEEKKLEEELVNDEKEKAEHIMLVDLGRNDLGKVCYPGTVRVTELMKIEKYSHVMHLVSNVEGKLMKNKSSVDLFNSTFPAGTLTGAPKIRAMEIIEELEGVRRGPYGGAVGYFSLQKSMDFCITIRTFIIKGKKIYIQAGAGIVADSVPEKEYEETENKAKALIESYNFSKRI
ncbi:MAG TPA: anthranilate synthase component I [bacterium]|nr:anthranilate synthase component I [bacterium]HOM25930.1 anthranilate synthase component I [bacterium]